MAQVKVHFGHEQVDLDVREGQQVPIKRNPFGPPVADVAAAMSQALASPIGFPPLRQALTPDDHIVVVVQENLTRLPDLLRSILECICDAGIEPSNITLLCPPRMVEGTPPPWFEQLPERFRSVAVEVHDPMHRANLSYLASTRAGRRIYLNRRLVDADQLVVLGGIDYDPVLGRSGGLTDIFPSMSDEETRLDIGAKVSDSLPGGRVRPARQEAQEVGWLLGMPFVIQVVPGQGDDISAIYAGAADLVFEASSKLQDLQWHVTIPRHAECVVAGIGGDPAQQRIGDVTMALAHAARAVQPGGRIALLSRARLPVGPSMEFLRQASNPAQGLMLARQQQLGDAVQVWQLATAAQYAQIYLLSDIPASLIEEIFMVPLEHAGQVQRLVDTSESCAFLSDAQRTLVTVQT